MTEEINQKKSLNQIKNKLIVPGDDWVSRLDSHIFKSTTSNKNYDGLF